MHTRREHIAYMYSFRANNMREACKDKHVRRYPLRLYSNRDFDTSVRVWVCACPQHLTAWTESSRRPVYPMLAMDAANIERENLALLTRPYMGAASPPAATAPGGK